MKRRRWQANEIQIESAGVEAINVQNEQRAIPECVIAGRVDVDARAHHSFVRFVCLTKQFDSQARDTIFFTLFRFSFPLLRSSLLEVDFFLWFLIKMT